MNKRAASPLDVATVGLFDKKAKTSKDDQIVLKSSSNELSIHKTKHSLKGPIVLLTGHDGEIFSCKFHPSGLTLASAGMDRSIFLWSARGECENYTKIRSAHSNAILDLQFSSDGTRLFSCSADNRIIIWDSATASRMKKLRNHQSHVNSISTSPDNSHLLASVSDDTFINIWDIRTRRCVKSYKDNYQLTAVSFNATSDQVFVGGIENKINTWDLRRDSIHYSMTGHSDTITGLSLSPDGHHLLSNSMDKSLRSWDVRPFAPENRLEKIITGHEHDFEKNLLRCSWSPNGNMIAAGSSDRLVHVWSFNTCEILYKLPGHRGSINEVVFSPIEPLILSGSSDRQMYLGEINYSLI